MNRGRIGTIGAVMLMLARAASAQVDQIPPSQVTWVDAELGSFAVTTSVTSVEFTRNGMNLSTSPDKLDGPSRWPDAVTPGWQGPLQYSIGFVFQVGGRWYASAPIESWWHKLDQTGPVQDQSVQCPNARPAGHGQIHCNIFYNETWSPLNTVQPSPGEQFGVFVAAGDVRNHYYGANVRERSNIVLVTLPNQGEERRFTFDPTALPPVSTTPGPTNPQPPVSVPPGLQTDQVMEYLRQFQQWAKMVTDDQSAQLKLIQSAVGDLETKQQLAYKDLTAQHEAQKGNTGGSNPFAFFGSAEFWKYAGSAIAGLVTALTVK